MSTQRIIVNDIGNTRIRVPAAHTLPQVQFVVGTPPVFSGRRPCTRLSYGTMSAQDRAVYAPNGLCDGITDLFWIETTAGLTCMYTQEVIPPGGYLVFLRDHTIVVSNGTTIVLDLTTGSRTDFPTGNTCFGDSVVCYIGGNEFPPLMTPAPVVPPGAPVPSPVVIPRCDNVAVQLHHDKLTPYIHKRVIDVPCPDDAVFYRWWIITRTHAINIDVVHDGYTRWELPPAPGADANGTVGGASGISIGNASGAYAFTHHRIVTWMPPRDRVYGIDELRAGFPSTGSTTAYGPYIHAIEVVDERICACMDTYGHTTDQAPVWVDMGPLPSCIPAHTRDRVRGVPMLEQTTGILLTDDEYVYACGTTHAVFTPWDEAAWIRTRIPAACDPRTLCFGVASQLPDYNIACAEYTGTNEDAPTLACIVRPDTRTPAIHYMYPTRIDVVEPWNVIPANDRPRGRRCNIALEYSRVRSIPSCIRVTATSTYARDLLNPEITGS